MSGDTLFTIGSGSFGWPETDYTTTNNAPFDCGPAAQSFSWHQLTVGSFENQVITLSISGPSNLLALCNEPEPTATFSASASVNGGIYSWQTSGGLQIVGPSSGSSVIVNAGNSNGGTASLTLTYTLNGQPMSTTSNVFVRKPTSLALNYPGMTKNPDLEIAGGRYCAETWGYQVLDQSRAPLVWSGLKATEKLHVNMACSETNWPVSGKANVDASSSFFTDTQNAPLGYAFSTTQTIIIHMADYSTNLPDSFGCPVLQNCIIFTGSTIENSISCCN
jgi:hypothetical protein